MVELELKVIWEMGEVQVCEENVFCSFYILSLKE